jgi:heme A synthase
LTALIRYALTALVAVGVGVAVLGVLLNDEGRRGTVLAGLIAYPVQVSAFWLLLRAKDRPSRFIVWWGAGIALRVAVVAAVGIASSRLASVEPAALLLSLVGFFFVLLLMEPVFLKADRADARTTA